MEAVAAVGEAFFSTMFHSLLENFTASDLVNFARNENVYKEVKKWKKMLQSIDAVLTDAEEKRVTKRMVRIWLTDLRDLAYDIEDVLDDLALEAWRRKSTAQLRPSTYCKLKRIFPSGLVGLNSRAVSFSVDMGSKIKEITTRLQEISAQKNDLELKENVAGSAYKVRDQSLRMTTSLVNEIKIFGRDKDKEAILNLLLEESSGGGEVSVIPITGMGGIGKTTLAQLAYNDDKVNGFFHKRAWISASQNFDVMNITKAILDQVVAPVVCDANYCLNLLQLKLKEELSGKKFLLVLDDVWHVYDDHWSDLIRPLEVGNSGSKIILTTRNQNVSQITGTGLAYPLKELAYDDCLSVLAFHALRRNNFDSHPHLKEVGEEIVKKCKGLPLAAKTLAVLLRNKLSCKEWEAVSKIKMWDLTKVKEVLGSLRLSYNHLPSDSKRCFAYCALIPKGYEFDKDELVLLWMAEGFLQQTQPEEVGHKCFSDLLSRSFFQQPNNNKSMFVMHDFLIDLAQSVAGDLCFNMEHEPQLDDCRENARHVSFIPNQFDRSQRFEFLEKMQRIRSLVALRPTSSYQGKYCYLSRKVSHQLLPKLKGLRVLSLSGYSIEDLPNSIGDLKHLRCLNLSKTAMRLLPESVCTLHHLQMLILSHCRNLTALPDQIDRLINLHHLDISGTPKLQEMPSGLGELTSLRVLPKFVIGKAGGLTLRDLKDLSHLQGQICISGLQNVVDFQDARVANLKHKCELKELALEWSNDPKLISRNGCNQKQVLEFLHPSKDLQKLSISCYGATTFPSWVGNPCFAKTEKLDLLDCMNCASLPSLGRLPLLRILNIKGMCEVTSLGPEFYGVDSALVKSFPSLEILRFENMTRWEKWDSSVGNVEVFPLLRELILHDCPELTGELPRTLPSLVKLDVQRCPRLTNHSPLSFSCLGELNVEDSSDTIFRNIVYHSSITRLKLKKLSGLACFTEELTKALVKLEVLEIEDCRELTCLWQKGAEQYNLLQLKSLVINNCPELVSLIRENQGLPLHCLSSLTDLKIERCRKFVLYPGTGLPCKLKCLRIHDCEALESLSDADSMNDLQELEIVGCPSLTSFRGGKLPSTLKVLNIQNCRNIQSFELQKNFNLQIFRMFNCGKISSLPDQMQKLTSLRELSLSDCEALESIPHGGLPPNITSLEFQNCKNLNQPMSKWGLDKLNFLRELKITGSCPAMDFVSFPDDEGIILPSFLTFLCIERLQNLQSISKGLGNLLDLEQLCIKDCPKLQELPKKDLPRSLGRLCIAGCPVLQDKCRKEKGEYWPFISNIPCLEFG